METVKFSSFEAIGTDTVGKPARGWGNNRLGQNHIVGTAVDQEDVHSTGRGPRARYDRKSCRYGLTCHYFGKRGQAPDALVARDRKTKPA